MQTPVQLALLWCSLYVCAFSGSAQQLPPLPPTIAAPVGDADFVKTPYPPQHPAWVRYTGGKLLISADNSSLTQILADIGQQTGMKISGGIADQRVFGTYGPGDPGAVLLHLLGGSGSSILVKEDASHKPRELILIPGSGGPTPPATKASAGEQDQSEDRPGEPQARAVSGEEAPAPAFGPAPQGDGGLPAAAPTGAEVAPGEAPAAETNDTTSEQSPNGVKTPQEIYDQLQRMQNRQAPPPQ